MGKRSVFFSLLALVFFVAFIGLVILRGDAEENDIFVAFAFAQMTLERTLGLVFLILSLAFATAAIMFRSK